MTLLHTMRIPTLHLSVTLCLMLAAGAQAQSPDVRHQPAATLLVARPAILPGPVEIEPLDAPGTAVAQDSLGFMWFGGDGLYRYDGYAYVHYQHDPEAPASLSQSWVEALHVDREGTLWVGTYGGGLNRFDAAKESFTHYRHDPADPQSLSQDSVTAILEDHRGVLWVGTHDGLNRFDRATGTFTRFRHDPDDPTSLSNRQVRVLYEDRAGTLWVGTGDPTTTSEPGGPGGLNRFDPATGTFTRYLHDPRDETTLVRNQIMSLFEDSRGTFWVGTLGDGLHTMDRATGTFTRYRYAAGDPTRLSRPFLSGTAGVPEACTSWECGGVSFIHEDQQGLLWVGGFEGGVIRYDPATGATSHYEPGTSGLRDPYVWRMHESRDGTLWISTWGSVYKVVSSATGFPHVASSPTSPYGLGGTAVTAFYEDPEGDLWLGMWDGGITRLDPTTGALTRFRADDPSRLVSNAVWALQPGRDGTLWAGHGDGGRLSRYDRAAGRFVPFPYDPTAGNNRHHVVRALLEDELGTLWIAASDHGLGRLDPATGHFTRFRHTPAVPGSLCSDQVSALHADEENTLWAGTQKGLCRLVVEPDTSFTTYLAGRNVTSLYEDSRGHFWVGTWGDGLYLFDRETGQFTRYGLEQGLPLVNVAALIEDDDGYLWISTAEGTKASFATHGRLSRLDVATSTFTNFDPDDGLPEIGFLPNSVFKSRDGTLFFGGTGGYTAFDPAALRIAPRQAPTIVLTELRVFNQAVRPGPDAPLQAPISLAEAVELGHDQNDVTLSYAALAFRDPDEVRYFYRLEPYDEAWVRAGTQRSARYSGLVPGTYTFRVRAVDSGGLSTADAASIRIDVLPPWWRSWWAYVLGALLVVSVVAVADRERRRRLIRGERLHARQRETDLLRSHKQELEVQNAQLERQKARLVELDAAKRRFFANVSHEFRTPLTLLLGPIENALDDAAGPDRLLHRLPVMHRNARRLLQLIDQLLDLARLESGTMTLRARRLELAAFVEQMVEAFAAQAEAEHITLQFVAEVETCDVYAEPDKLEKIVSNLVSNAFKFTPSGGRIRLRVHVEADGYAVVEVRDTGQGIAPEELPHIFDRFHQADATSTRERGGVGIGLSLTQELVELHGGRIEVESEVGFGTVVRVHLPLDPAHLPEGSVVELALAPPSAAPMPAPLTPPPDPTEDDADDRDAHAPENAPLVLVVEDNAELRRYVCEHLAEDYRVAEAADGLAAMEVARARVPDLIVADVMMPRMDGVALLRGLRRDEALGHVPVILLTAKADEESRLEGLETGADDYLAKPFSMDELLVRVENLIALRRRLRQRFSGEVVLKPTDVSVPSQEAVFLEQVRETVEQHLGEPGYSVDDLADAIGLSRRQLHRKMKTLADLTPAGYIRMMRLERAAQLLEQRAGNVSEVAYAVGFQDAYYFSRLFKQSFGVSPSAFAERRASHSAEA